MLKTLEMSDAELMEAARDVLASNGWIQDRSEDHCDRHCLGGAITCAAFGVASFRALGGVVASFDEIDEASVMQNRLRRAVEETIAEHYGEPWAIESWNDHPSRIYNDVEAVVEKTVAKLAEQA